MSEGLKRLREYEQIHDLVYALAREKEIHCSLPASHRLAQIAGFILGLDYAGQTRLAEKMANDLFNVFDRLTASQDYIVSEKGTKAPKLKHELYTDRAFFSFGFQRLVGEVNPTRRVCHEIHSTLGVTNPQKDNVSYVYDIVGGIIYDGPGGSRAFSVNLENDSRLWTIHS